MFSIIDAETAPRIRISRCLQIGLDTRHAHVSKLISTQGKGDLTFSFILSMTFISNQASL